ncbi:tripartite tricarboxylate transporter substrate binding protein [Variovorax sp. Sphag1AA]|uniref:Bug family tripartite tricarboxylate transporter substrate binding protein n=1 Tax=Variovorax sp. Sphag1AA TaxID=2587027 RepID=UPI00161A80CB|nr:tripartite tricarboxylate transporter substrate binding protein [Variovorax sp. Sphag1AA]MBB3182437.1 tripartite-type tricarboxylate transporter receptor subunit TctC [Variovorax sp. Sphag1AA]
MSRHRKSGSTSRRAFIAATAASLVVAAPWARAQQGFPGRTVTLLVPFPPGGGADTLSRILAPSLGRTWHQSVVVDNRPGASGKIGASAVARGTADGHMLLMASTGAIDESNSATLAPVALVSASPYIAVVHPSLGIKSVRDLIARAKSQPGKLSFGSSGEGSASQLTVELFKQMAGVDMLHVPYKGTGQAVTDLLAGTIQLMFAPGQAVLPHVASGKLVAIAVTSAQRARAAPALPTIAESGVPGYAASGWFGLFAPASTPGPVVNRISDDVNALMQTPEIIDAMLKVGAEPALGKPAQFAHFVQEELAKWSRLEAQLAARQNPR